MEEGFAIGEEELQVAYLRGINGGVVDLGYTAAIVCTKLGWRSNTHYLQRLWPRVSIGAQYPDHPVRDVKAVVLHCFVCPLEREFRHLRESDPESALVFHAAQTLRSDHLL